MLNKQLIGSAFSSYHYYNTPEDQVCSVLVGLIRNHAFADGNKRTAFATFKILSLHFHLKIQKSEQEMFDIILSIATSKISVEDVSSLIFQK